MKIGKNTDKDVGRKLSKQQMFYYYLWQKIKNAIKHYSMIRRRKASTLLEAFDRDNQVFKMRVGKDRAENTYKVMLRTRCYVEEFLANRYQLLDIGLEDLSLDFIQSFSIWLSTDRGLTGGSIWLACQQLKGVVTRSYQKGELRHNPFYQFHIAKNIRPREFLTEEELRVVSSHEFTKPVLCFARDVFVFSCLTGLAFIDMKELSVSDIKTINGKLWIVARRHKTKIPYQVQLLPVCIDILKRYEGLRQTGHVFGDLQYRTLCKRVKRVMAECGIQKNIGIHCARHTFAVLALSKGMPIESVSRILGHTNITTTQIYARITIEKLSEDFDSLASNVSL